MRRIWKLSTMIFVLVGTAGTIRNNCLSNMCSAKQKSVIENTALIDKLEEDGNDELDQNWDLELVRTVGYKKIEKNDTL